MVRVPQDERIGGGGRQRPRAQHSGSESWSITGVLRPYDNWRVTVGGTGVVLLDGGPLVAVAADAAVGFELGEVGFDLA